MSHLPTPPRLGLRVPLPPAPRDSSAPPADVDGLRNGDLLDGRYQIEERIGEGGVGFVYRALQLKLHRRVAVKLLQRDMVGDEELRPRFEREALTLAALSHPNIVSLQDYGMLRGQPFLVMELLEGRTLREVIDVEGALAPERALSFTRQVLQGLAYAHELGVVHRDLKPANLLVQALPAHEHVKVLDFGLVKLLPGSYLDRGVQLSRVGFTFGTPPYMSPEHATGGNVDARSDLYSMGILLFEMLTGQKPYDGELHEVIRHHLSTPIPKLADRKPALAGRDDLQRLIDGSLAKMRDERYASAVELLQALDGLGNPRLPGISAEPVMAADVDTADADFGSRATDEAPDMALELRSMGASSLRFLRASLRWLGLWATRALLPWLRNLGARLRERTQGARSRLSERVQGARERTEENARSRWQAAKPRLENVKGKLIRASQQAKARLRGQGAQTSQAEPDEDLEPEPFPDRERSARPNEPNINERHEIDELDAYADSEPAAAQAPVSQARESLTFQPQPSQQPSARLRQRR